MAKKKTTKTVDAPVETEEKKTVEAPKASTVTYAFVYDKNMRLMRTFTQDNGNDFVKQAEALAAQPRRNGWTVVTR